MRFVLRSLFVVYYCLVGFPLYILATIITCLCIIIGCALGRGDWASSRVGRIWGRVCLWLNFCPIEIRGAEHIPHDGATYVVVANHQSSFDIYALYGYIPIRFKWVLKEELRKVPLLGWACASAGFVYVDDTRPSSIKDALEQAAGVLRDAYSIFIFPEGSRTETGRLARFKKGAFLMASGLDAPILPVTIEGAYQVLPKGKKLPRPHRITLTIHSPYRVSELGDAPMNIQYATRRAQQLIASALPEEER